MYMLILSNIGGIICLSFCFHSSQRNKESIAQISEVKGYTTINYVLTKDFDLFFIFSFLYCVFLRLSFYSLP